MNHLKENLSSVLGGAFSIVFTIILVAGGFLGLFGEDLADRLPRPERPELTVCYEAAHDEYSPVIMESFEYKKWGVPNSQLSVEDRAEKKRLSAKLDQANAELDAQRDKCLQKYNPAAWQALKEFEAEYEI